MKKFPINIITIALFVFVIACSQHDQQLSTGQDGETRAYRPATNEEIITARDELKDLSTGTSPVLSSLETDANKEPV
ncbi:MAG: hypothetical protein GTO60_03745, partial [Gammaproteobacteria bacterium]|nr:hypothetical protein [Gammaproteobacteria bacterium]NIO61562.1 hypothetical protein [Gammaproteobacteria bacterium]